MTEGIVQVYFLNFLYAIGGVILGLFCAYLVYRIFDKLTPSSNIDQELKNGNLAVAIALGCLFIMIGLMVGLIIGLGLH